MDKELLQTIIIAAVALVLGLPILRLIGQGRISSLSGGRDGLKVDMSPLDQRDGMKFHMDRSIIDIDEALDAKVKEKTRALRRPLARVVAGAGLCSPAKQSVALGFRDVIDQAVDDNNLRDNLSGAERPRYLGKKLVSLHDEYDDLLEETSGDPCSAGPAATIFFPAWASVEPRLLVVLNSWAEAVAQLIVSACQDKIQVYKEYRPQFESAKREYYVKVCDDCIAKNEGYIKALGGEA